MARFQAYILPLNDDGTYQSDWVNVSKYTDWGKLSKISQKLDNNEFEVGLFRYNNFGVSFFNESGLFSEVGSNSTIFKFKRSDSKVRITWSRNDFDVYPGLFYPGTVYPHKEQVIFEGFLDDSATALDVRRQVVSMKSLGYESIFSKVTTPFSAISNGDKISEILSECFDLSAISSILPSYSISLSVDSVIDDVSDLENSTVKETLDTLLEIGNAVLYLEDNSTINVVNRTPTVSNQYTFYGQAAVDGVENITALGKIKNGLNRMFNYWTWKDTTLLSEDSTSTAKYGVDKKEVGFTGVTTGATQQAIIDELRTEWSTPKQELELKTPLNFERFNLFLLDKVNIDYPTVSKAIPGEELPVWETPTMVWDESVWPLSDWSLTIKPTAFWKIIGRSVDMKAQQLIFNLREI